MSFFKKAMASLTGAGGSRIDTRLEKDTYVQGEVVRGELFIFGGEVVQELDDVYVTLLTNAEAELGNRDMSVPAALQKIKIDIDRKIMPREEIVIPFSFQLAPDTPISLHKSRIWLHTKLDIESSVDPSDQDHIRILPSQGLSTVIEALQGIGFQMKECESKIDRGRIVQEFEFYPTGGHFRGRLDELEMNYFDMGNEIHLYFQVDRRVRDFRSAMQERMGADETRIRVTFPKASITDKEIVMRNLAEFIGKYS